jgi:hypothetical protein
MLLQAALTDIVPMLFESSKQRTVMGRIKAKNPT